MWQRGSHLLSERAAELLLAAECSACPAEHAVPAVPAEDAVPAVPAVPAEHAVPAVHAVIDLLERVAERYARQQPG